MKSYQLEGQEAPVDLDTLRGMRIPADARIREVGSDAWLRPDQIEDTTALIEPGGQVRALGLHWGPFQKDGPVGNGYRQYSSVLWGIPPGQSWEQTCAVTPAVVRGHAFPHPTRCVNTGTNIWGEFHVPDTSCVNPPSFGRYLGRVVSRWLDDGRRMQLLEDFAYIDPHGIRWDAPAGSVVDGASIPQQFWSTIGGPFEGKYREASVIHDIACDRRNRPWTDVHWVFHEAMLASGVHPAQAQIMFAAVWGFGPKW